MTAKLTMPAAVLFALLLPQAALADLWGCVFTNGAPCTWVCFETDLTCADITITNTGIQQCEDCPIAPGGGVGLPGALATVHPDFDGQINLGSGPFPGSIAFQGRTLHDFIITRPIGAVLNSGPLVRALAFDDEGNIYTALPPTSPVAGYDPDLHDCAVQATRLGEPLLNPFDATPLGTVATGDVTLSVHVFAAGDGSSPVSASFFDVDFAGLAWSYYGSGAVANEALSWGALKAAY